MMTTQLPSELTAARTAREQLRQYLGQRGLQAVADDAELVVSELVANAVRYGRSPITLRISQSTGALRIEVQDAAPGSVPATRQASFDATGGRGLLLVEAVSSSWGCDIHEDCKVVWAEFDITG